MEKSGIVYLMKTVIKGVYKIGISDENNFENRMRYLENNGYANVVGLERILAIKTDNYKEKEALLHEIFGKSGTKLTTEIEDGLHIYTTYSKKGLKQAYSEYLTLFESK